MKKTFLLAALVLTLGACNNSKKQEKALQQEVLDFHEKVMADDEQAMICKMKLDTIVHTADSLKTDKTMPAMLRAQLTVADNLMSDWMKNFTLDYTGKTHEEIMDYLAKQKVEIKGVDSLLQHAVKEAKPYLQKQKTK